MLQVQGVVIMVAAIALTTATERLIAWPDARAFVLFSQL